MSDTNNQNVTNSSTMTQSLTGAYDQVSNGNQIPKLPTTKKLGYLKKCLYGFIGLVALYGCDNNVSNKPDAAATNLPVLSKKIFGVALGENVNIFMSSVSNVNGIVTKDELYLVDAPVLPDTRLELGNIRNGNAETDLPITVLSWQSDYADFVKINAYAYKDRIYAIKAYVKDTSYGNAANLKIQQSLVRTYPDATPLDRGAINQLGEKVTTISTAALGDGWAFCADIEGQKVSFSFSCVADSILYSYEAIRQETFAELNTKKIDLKKRQDKATDEKLNL